MMSSDEDEQDVMGTRDVSNQNSHLDLEKGTSKENKIGEQKNKLGSLFT